MADALTPGLPHDAMRRELYAEIDRLNKQAWQMTAKLPEIIANAMLAEREECAKIAESQKHNDETIPAALWIAAAIRGRSNG